MLELHDIALSYDGQPLLDKISFRLTGGETLALLGPSGSGKTTLLRIIAGLERAESGEVNWDGNALRDMPPDRRNFGLVFQDYALFPHLNVAGNIAFGISMHGSSRAEQDRIVREMLDLVNLSGCEHRRVDSLSGGEQQRVALGRALATCPRLLMLDEPLSALDRALRRELVGEIKQILRQTRIPAIYVTHDQEEAFAVATRIAILHDGRILQESTPEHILAHPATGWIAEFLGLGTVISGKIQKGSPLRAKTRYGEFEIVDQQDCFTSGQKVSLLLRPENGKIKRTPERGSLWKIGKVQDIRKHGTWNRLLISMAGGLTVSCDVKQLLAIGTRVWWHPGKAQFIGLE
jgi:spermidine/putrescine transport system ATP-binding protein